MKFVLVVIIAAAMVSMALAAPDDAAIALFEAGAFEEAAAVAEQSGNAESFALAARSLNAAAYLETDNKTARRTAKRALGLAERAIEEDPALVEGHLQAAISYAQRGARMSPIRAFVSGTAGKARDLLDHALSIEPDNAWALSSSGAWHLEVARRAGDGSYGSDPDLGRQQFAAARAADPQNLLIAYEAALRLLADDDATSREIGLAALKDATTLAPQDAFERRIQARAEVFQKAVDSGQEAERDFIKAQP